MFNFFKKKKNKVVDKEQVGISLKKKDVESLTAEVYLAVDVSGSMEDVIYNGDVQKALDRVVPISLTFDDDGVIPTYVFSTDVRQVADLTVDSLEGYSDKVLKRHLGGGTNYAPTLRALLRRAKDNKIKFPAFVLFITDGDNFDEQETSEVLRELSNYDIYIQFIGVGRSGFEYLKRLDNLSGRKFDNAGFISFKDFKKFSDKDIYDELLDEFVEIYKKNTFKSGKIKLTK